MTTASPITSPPDPAFDPAQIVAAQLADEIAATIALGRDFIAAEAADRAQMAQLRAEAERAELAKEWAPLRDGLIAWLPEWARPFVIDPDYQPSEFHEYGRNHYPLKLEIPGLAPILFWCLDQRGPVQYDVTKYKADRDSDSIYAAAEHFGQYFGHYNQPVLVPEAFAAAVALAADRAAELPIKEKQLAKILAERAERIAAADAAEAERAAAAQVAPADPVAQVAQLLHGIQHALEGEIPVSEALGLATATALYAVAAEVRALIARIDESITVSG